jgi:CPA2 family monovalent cation:H+ antiporter-2
LTAAIVAGKIAITTGAVSTARIPLHVALLTGVALAQIGEFSFVLLQTASSVGAVRAAPYQLFLSCSVLSMALTPVLFGMFRKLIMRIAQSWSPQVPFGRYNLGTLQVLGSLKDHVIICGFGLGGQSIARVLKANRIPYVVIDLNEQRVSEARNDGEPIIFDCTSTHIGACGNWAVPCHCVRHLRSFDNCLAVDPRDKSREHCGADTHQYVTDIDALWDQGSNEVISEEFEASLELMTRILRVYNAPRAMVAAEIKSIRDQRFGIFRERHTTVPRIRLSSELDIYSETWDIAADCIWVGATISDTRLREETGVLILGVIRKNQTLNNPRSSETIFAGDRLAQRTKDSLRTQPEAQSNRSDAKLCR